jgi:hypothetical protein
LTFTFLRDEATTIHWYHQAEDRRLRKNWRSWFSAPVVAGQPRKKLWGLQEHRGVLNNDVSKSSKNMLLSTVLTVHDLSM